MALERRKSLVGSKPTTAATGGAKPDCDKLENELDWLNDTIAALEDRRSGLTNDRNSVVDDIRVERNKAEPDQAVIDSLYQQLRSIDKQISYIDASLRPLRERVNDILDQLEEWCREEAAVATENIG